VNVSSIRSHFNRFPLIGAHATLQCDDCHRGAATSVFVGLSTACVSCHQRDFQQAATLNHVAANLPVTCETCHTMDQWLGAKFDHTQFARFSLTGVHAQLPCSACHVGNRFQGTPAECYGCHAQAFASTTKPNHVTAGFPRDCSWCHTTANWQGATFDHNTTKFGLTGAHISVDCSACHINGRFAGTPTDCAGCHLADYTKTTNPNHRSLNLATQCDSCHTTANWQGAKFDHNLTKFPLTGAHIAIACTQCHVGGQFTAISTDCVSCHLNNFNNTTNPNHSAANFPTNCGLCHTTTAWTGAQFNHNTATKFPLTGAHVSVACNQCHVGGKFAGIPTDCASCHISDFNKTTNPSHVTAGFPTLCSACHITTSWSGAQFDHSKTPFPLTGAHVTVACSQCHVGGKFTGLSTDCASCHLKDFQNTINPHHTASGFPTTCSSCHTTTNWLGATFDHGKTGFTLTGFHTTLQCAQCHVNNNFALTSGACISCHLTDFNNANNPPHKSSGFPQDCTPCHTTTNWTSATFNHAATGFDLTGFHATMQCAQCHVNNNYSLNSPLCINCHQNDYNGTNNPPHQATGFPTTCGTCHTTANWLGATFNHATTGFALTGFHTTLQCTQCHVNSNYSLNSPACINCHLTDYKNANNPPHTQSGFPQDCTLCHSTTNWTKATFNHSTTGFPLTGFHATMQCAQCHVNNNYRLNSPACINCHQNDYNNTNNPAHPAAGFPTTCDTCHNTTSWNGATFNHSTTGWALTGIHATTPCTSCHVGGNYRLTSTACYGCHQADYRGTNNPNHVAAGFPTTCDTCHTTSGWTGATFNHTWFPVPHHSARLCTDCHTNSSNYAVFVCTVCHTQAQTDAHHQGVQGYVWNSANCYACHPHGGGD